MQSKQSFLYCEGKVWVKKGEEHFDVGMGGWDGAQTCETVGLFFHLALQR